MGTAAVTVRTQRLADGQVRLRLPRPLPLVAGDRAVLRDPGRREVLAGVGSQVDLTRPPRPARRPRVRRALAATGPAVGPASSDASTGHRRCRDAGGAGRHASARWTGWLRTRCRRPSRDQLDGWGAHRPATWPAAARRGEILRMGGVVLAGDAVATRRGRPAPAAAAVHGRRGAARALGTSRRVAVPLLERLDATLVKRTQARECAGRPGPRDRPAAGSGGDRAALEGAGELAAGGRTVSVTG